MRGEIVIVRAYGGQPLVSRVWNTTPTAVAVCSEETFQRLAAGEDAPMPIGFAPEDVFCYDPNLLPVLETSYQYDPSIWDRLTVWRDDKQIAA